MRYTRGCTTLSLALAHVVVDCRQTLFSPGAPVGVVGGCTTFVGVVSSMRGAVRLLEASCVHEV